MRIDRYEVVDELGAGGMGVVFKSFDPREGRFVAIKMIGHARNIRATVHAGAQSRNAAFNARRRIMLVREASLAGRLQHPNIVRVFDYGQFRGLLYIVMEYLEGRSLDRVIRGNNFLGLDQKLEIGAQLLDALAFAHGHGIIHRDIKPPNTLLCDSGLLKVLDFGLVATFSQIAQGRVMREGTWFYMAPEALIGGTDHRGDIWAAGVTIYELISGTYPFAAPSVGQVYSNIFHLPCPRLPESMPHSAQLHAILSNALNKDPAYRYAGAAEFARDLRRLTGLVSTASPIAGQSCESRVPSSTSAATIDIHSFGKQFEEEVVLESRTSRLRKVIGVLDRLEFSDAAKTTLVPIPHVLPILLGVAYFLVGAAKLALVPLEMADYWSSIPPCRVCAQRMGTLNRITRFAFSPVEIQFALADCISALRENLWDDAIKLFSIHTYEFAPSITNRIADAPLRYHLGIFECRRCGQRCAQLVTDEKDGERWVSRPQFVRAYQSSGLEHEPPTAFTRASGFLRTLGQAAKAGFSRMTFLRTALIVTLAIAIFVGAGWLLKEVIGRGPWERPTPHSRVR